LVKFKKTALGIAASIALIAAVPAFAEDVTPSAKPDSEIPFADLGGISGWNADGDKGLFIQGNNGKWYYAEMMGYCPNLANAETIAFASKPTGSFNKFSSIIVDHKECRVKSLVERERPKKKSE